MKLLQKEPAHFHRGPRLVPISLVYIALAIAGVVAGFALRQGGKYVTPYDSPEQILHFMADFPVAVRLSAFLLFASAVPLGIFTATIVSRLRFLGVRAAGTDIAMFGGLLSSFALAGSGLSLWTLSVRDIVSEASVTHAIYFIGFLLGGVAFAVGFGLLAAGISVTSGFANLLPRGLVVLGLLIAVAGELSTLSLLFYPASFLLPVTRFGGMLWLIAASATLPRTRAMLLGEANAVVNRA